MKNDPRDRIDRPTDHASSVGDLTPPPGPAVPEPVESDPMLASELDRARAVQSRLLPSQIPAVPGFDIAARYLPATHVGGDYYDVFPLPGGRLGFIVADVSGKSISAAMIMVMARTVFHAVAPAASSAKAAVVEAARLISPDLPAGTFLTVIYAILDPARATVTIVNCGHNPPLLRTTLGSLPVVETVLVSGAAMGFLRGGAFERTLSERVIPLRPCDHLLLHTDGVNEAMNVNSVEFGDRQLFKAVMRGGGKDADGMVQEIVNAVLHHRGIAPASDDLTVLDVWRLP